MAPRCGAVHLAHVGARAPCVLCLTPVLLRLQGSLLGRDLRETLVPPPRWASPDLQALLSLWWLLPLCLQRHHHIQARPAHG